MTPTALLTQWRPEGKVRWYRPGDVVKITGEDRALFRIIDFAEYADGSTHVHVIGGKRARVRNARTFPVERIRQHATRRITEEFLEGRW